MIVESRIKTAFWTDYLSLTKPRVVLLHIITAAAAMFIAANGQPPLVILLATLAGGGLMAGASNALNCYFDRDIDRMMDRTSRRPLAAGRVNPGQALFFTLVIALAGFLILDRLVNWQVAGLSAVAMAYYILVYTLWLKRHTYWSSIVGSGAGAFPPVIGWLAVTGHIGLVPFLLFALIVLWTPPHFWSLAIFRRLDYRKAGLSILPVGGATTWIVIFSILLIAVSGLLVPLAGFGYFYQVTAATLGLALLVLAAWLNLPRSGDNLRAAHYLYLFSIFYLVILFGAMMADRIFWGAAIV
jgi:heme o synthase